MHLANLLSIQTFTYLVVPLGAVLISWIFQRGFSMKPNTAGDIFAFSFALDLVALIQRPSLTGRINPRLSPYYVQIFAIALILSVIFLFYAVQVQALIYKRKGKRYYPYGKVSFCLGACIAIIAFYLYALAWS